MAQTTPALAGNGSVTANSTSNRIVTLDILRGLALLGMILAHVHKTMAHETTLALTSRVGWFITLFAAEKDRIVFAFLFGISFAIMIERLQNRLLPATAIFLRRLLVLYVIGFAVEALTRFSILRDYAWWGAPLLFLRNYPTRTLLVIALISVTAFSFRTLVDTGYGFATDGQIATLGAERAQDESWSNEARKIRESIDETNYPAVIAGRIQEMARDFFSLRTVTPPVYLALFILGFLSIRHRLFVAPGQHVRLITGIMAAGLFVWVAYWWLLPLIPNEYPTPRLAARLRTGFGLVDEQFLAFTYIGAVTLLIAYRPVWEFRLTAIAWVGQMALTNYILQAALIDFLSEPYGLGLILTPAQEVLVAASLFVAQILVSRFWLSRFRFGPAEWIWRCLTYGKMQPLRLGSNVALAKSTE